MTAIAPSTVTITPSQLATQFSSFAVALAGNQGELSKIENRHIYPGYSWSQSMGTLASRLDDARTGYVQLRPSDTSFISQLGADVRGLSFTAGQMNMMAGHTITFGGGWANSLSPAISDAQQAVASLAGAPATA